MKIWSVVNQKGGVGKTTTAIALAGLAAEQGQRILMIDLDPHACLTSFFRLDASRLQQTSLHLFEEEKNITQDSIQRRILITKTKHLHLLGASPALANVERIASGFMGAGLKLKRSLQHLENSYDVVIIDGPPMLGLLMINAILAASTLLLPVQTEYFGLVGLERTMETLTLMAKEVSITDNQVIVPTLYDRRTHASMASLEKLREQHDERLWRNQIHLDTKLRDAMERGVFPHQLNEECSAVTGYKSLLHYLQNYSSASPMETAV